MGRASVILVFVLVSTICSIDRHVQDCPADLGPAGVAQVLCPAFGAAVWLCGVVAQVYVFLIWLEERAAQRTARSGGAPSRSPQGLAYLKYSRALPPWILIVIFVVLPLGLMVRSCALAVLNSSCWRRLLLFCSRSSIPEGTGAIWRRGKNFGRCTL